MQQRELAVPVDRADAERPAADLLNIAPAFLHPLAVGTLLTHEPNSTGTMARAYGLGRSPTHCPDGPHRRARRPSRRGVRASPARLDRAAAAVKRQARP